MLLRFGYNAGLPADNAAEAAWGCRAIVTQQGDVDVVPDRTSVIGDGPALDRLVITLNEAGWGWRERASALLSSGEMHTRRAGEHVLFNNGVVVIKGNTNASAGYLYVCAYLIGERRGES